MLSREVYVKVNRLSQKVLQYSDFRVPPGWYPRVICYFLSIVRRYINARRASTTIREAVASSLHNGLTMFLAYGLTMFLYCVILYMFAEQLELKFAVLLDVKLRFL